MASGISKWWWILGFVGFMAFCAIVWHRSGAQEPRVHGGQPPEKQMNETDRARQAILRVMKGDQQLSQKLKVAPPNPTPSQIAWLVGNYCDELERLNMSDCPADFRVAYKQHMRAWRDAHIAIKELPDGFLEGFFMGFMNGLLRGEQDGGQGRLEGKIRTCEERIRTTWEHVERIAAGYGAAL